MLNKLLTDMKGIQRSSRMNKEQKADLINKIVVSQGELQRLMIWASRLFDDLEKLKMEVMVGED